MANVWEAMKKHQQEQAAAEAAQSQQVNAAPQADAPTQGPADQGNVPAEPGPMPQAQKQVHEPTPGEKPVQAPAERPARIASVLPTTIKAAQATTGTAHVQQTKYAPCLMASHDRGGWVCEEYRSLRTNLLAKCGERGFCYLVTSSEPGEGKTVTIGNLGLVLAERVNQNTLLIDGDLRKRRLAELLGLKRSPGLAEYLRGQASLKEIIQPTSQPNLSMIASGVADHDEVAKLLGRPELGKIIADVRRMFDHVLIDTPPINSVSDAGIIGHFCNEALMVIRMNKTRRESVERALALLHSASIKPVGMVLTHRRYYIPKYLYRYA